MLNLRFIFVFPRSIPLVWIVLIGFLMLCIACGDSEKQELVEPSSSFHIVVNDSGYTHPEYVAAGMVHLVFENKGTSLHEMMFVKLPYDMSAEAYLEEVKQGTSFPEGAIDYSGPGLISAGKKFEMWLSLDPGTYLLACWYKNHLISIKPHTLLVVNRDKTVLKPPKEDVTIKMIDFRFELDGELKEGSQVIKVETVGPSMHEVDLFRLNEGKTIDDLRNWQKSGKKGVAPVSSAGGVLDSHDLDRVVWLKVNLQKGNYVLWCNMDMVPDSEDPDMDMSHADAGMFKEITIGD